MRKLVLLIGLLTVAANAQVSCHHSEGSNYAYCNDGTTMRFRGNDTTVTHPDGSVTMWRHNTTSWGDKNYSTNSYSDSGDYSQSTTTQWGEGNTTTNRTITHADGTTIYCHTSTINGYSHTYCY